MTRSVAPSYKEITLQQLRCFCETARHGSFVASASALEVSNPTVWKQVHALERTFGVQLVEPHRRGCYLTAAGRLLVQLVGPAVESIAALRERFQAALSEEGPSLTIAVTPRILVEDLMPCVVVHRERTPRSRLRFLELPDEEVAGAVEARRADFGFSPILLTEAQQQALVAEPAYPLETRLVTARDHPLARRRDVKLRDLVSYPIVNAPDDASFAAVRAALGQKADGFDEGFVVQAYFATSIRRLVELGFGIGFIPAPPAAPIHPGLHERSLGRHIRRADVQVIRRRGAFLAESSEAFVDLVRKELQRRPRRKRSGRV